MRFRVRFWFFECVFDGAGITLRTRTELSYSNLNPVDPVLIQTATAAWRGDPMRSAKPETDRTTEVSQ